MNLTHQICLNDELLLAKGGERLCYLHPDDRTKVIKVAYKESRRQNKLDNTYYGYLKETKKSLEQITKCFGYIDTNMGEGLIFERVLDFDGEASLSLKEVIKQKLISVNTQRELLTELLEYLRVNQILFIDIGTSNILCQKLNQGQYKFIIVDGLGARRLNYKYWLYVHIGVYRRYKIRKQSERMVKNHERSLVN